MLNFFLVCRKHSRIQKHWWLYKDPSKVVTVSDSLQTCHQPGWSRKATNQKSHCNRFIIMCMVYLTWRILIPIIPVDYQMDIHELIPERDTLKRATKAGFPCGVWLSRSTLTKFRVLYNNVFCLVLSQRNLKIKYYILY